MNDYDRLLGRDTVSVEEAAEDFLRRYPPRNRDKPIPIFELSVLVMLIAWLINTWS